MNVYTCTDHSGYIPASPAVVIVAKDESQARQLLETILAECNVRQHIVEKYGISLLDTSQAGKYILYECN